MHITAIAILAVSVVIFMLFLILSIKRKQRIWYTIGVIELLSVVFAEGLVVKVTLRSITYFAVLSFLVLVMAFAFERKRWNLFTTIGILFLVVVFIKAIISVHNLYDILLVISYAAVFAMLGAEYYMGKRRGISFSEINVCSTIDRKVLGMLMVATFLVIIVIMGAILMLPSKHAYENSLMFKVPGAVMTVGGMYGIYRILVWTIDRCRGYKGEAASTQS